MSTDISKQHIWLSNVEGPRARGERALYLGRHSPGDKIQVRFFADGTGTNPKHHDVYLTDVQARRLALWLIRHLLGDKEPS